MSPALLLAAAIVIVMGLFMGLGWYYGRFK